MFFEASLDMYTPKEKEFDVVIVGGGPAGCTAAIYARRFNLSTLLISDKFGGTITNAGSVENYPGIPRISGSELGKMFVNHAKEYGVKFYQGRVERVYKRDKGFSVKLSDGTEFSSKALVLATGERHRRLNVPEEEQFLGKGISYCAVCDAPLFKGKKVVVVGGGNVAFSDAQILAKHASMVYLIHRRNWFRADPIEVERVRKTSNIKILTPYVIKKVKGKEKVEGVVLEKTKEENGEVIPTGETMEIDVDGIFVAIGLVPTSELARLIGAKINEKGYIVVDELMRTTVDGVFAAGDCTDKASKFRQVIVAAAQGAIAAFSAFKYLKNLK